MEAEGALMVATSSHRSMNNRWCHRRELKGDCRPGGACPQCCRS